MVKLQEAENQIITGYEVYARRPYDSDLLVAAIETHQALLGRAPRLVAADAAFYSAKNEAAAKAKGVKRVCIPNRSTKSPERKREQRKRWFRDGQKWRTGCEGRISVVKRRHGLDRCRYKGSVGMDRWVGLGVIADAFHTDGGDLSLKNRVGPLPRYYFILCFCFNLGNQCLRQAKFLIPAEGFVGEDRDCNGFDVFGVQRMPLIAVDRLASIGAVAAARAKQQPADAHGASRSSNKGSERGLSDGDSRNEDVQWHLVSR